MPAEPQTAADFYATAHGAVALRLVRDRLTRLWPDLSGQTLLGLGQAAPYLPAWHAAAARCLSATARRGIPWPHAGRSLACVVTPDALPFSDLSLDRVLLVHGLENAADARRMLREVWRVLKDDGRLLVVTPNRAGLWAHAERTPFGHGQLYSPGQVGDMLRSSLFRVERRDGVLYLPPTRNRILLRNAGLLEQAGRRVAPNLAGVAITEAVKDVYAALPLSPAPRRRFVLHEAG